jgi:hypothetical protein
MVQKHNQTPTLAGSSGKMIPYTRKTRTFKYYNKLLEEINFKEIKDIVIYATLPENRDDTHAPFSTLLDINGSRSYLGIYYEDSVVSFDVEYIKNLVKINAKYVPFRYGIVYKRFLYLGPVFYAMGVIVGRISDKKRKNITKWFHHHGDEKYQVGNMRDLYPLSFLCLAHLERDVYEQSLKQWIESLPEHGVLEPLTSELWSWEIPEEKIPVLREALGLLVS